MSKRVDPVMKLAEDFVASKRGAIYCTWHPIRIAYEAMKVAIRHERKRRRRAK